MAIKLHRLFVVTSMMSCAYCVCHFRCELFAEYISCEGKGTISLTWPYAVALAYSMKKVNNQIETMLANELEMQYFVLPSEWRYQRNASLAGFNLFLHQDSRFISLVPFEC